MNYFILGALQVLNMGYNMSFYVHGPKTGLEKPGVKSGLLILLYRVSLKLKLLFSLLVNSNVFVRNSIFLTFPKCCRLLPLSKVFLVTMISKYQWIFSISRIGQKPLVHKKTPNKNRFKTSPRKAVACVLTGILRFSESWSKISWIIWSSNWRKWTGR